MNDQEKKLKYELIREDSPSGGTWKSGKEFMRFIKGDGKNLAVAFVMIIINSAAVVVTPYLVALALDKYISHGDIAGLKSILVSLTIIYVVSVVSGYYQGKLTGGVSQRTLFRLRAALFGKLQELPIAFFNQNKAGDLMSRINNDTDKLNQFLSESISRFVSIFFSMLGIAIFVLVINWKLGITMLITTLVLAVLTHAFSPWIEKQNKRNLNAVGALSAALQENLSNFRVIVAYNRRAYLKQYLTETSEKAFKTAFKSDTANRVFEPIYDFGSSIALILVLVYGLYLVGTGEVTLGILVAFISYTQRFYDPLRTLATIFGTIQLSVAAWSRIRAVFSLENDLIVKEIESLKKESGEVPRLEIRDVSFSYENSGMVIENANLRFYPGKTYALVGPTGGGKSTLASLMSRLYDPISGVILLNGKDIRTYEPKERASRISVILQDPLLFSGTVSENIRYGNENIENIDDRELALLLEHRGFKEVIERFPQGLATSVTQGGGSLSIGQKQLISFMRAILREPEMLILDEATANIDTITEAILNKTLESLPRTTTKIIIAHRLNTIKEADEIMFVNGHHVTRAGDFHEALHLIEHSKRKS